MNTCHSKGFQAVKQVYSLSNLPSFFMVEAKGWKWGKKIILLEKKCATLLFIPYCTVHMSISKCTGQCGINSSS